MSIYQTVCRGLASEAAAQAAHESRAIAAPSTDEQARAAWDSLLAIVAGDEIRAIAIAAVYGDDAAVNRIADILRNQ